MNTIQFRSSRVARGGRPSPLAAIAMMLAITLSITACDRKDRQSTAQSGSSSAARHESPESPGRSEPPNTIDPYWVHRATPNARVAVVFVHGLFGSTTSSWVNGNGRRFFDFVEAHEGVGDRVDIFAFGFTSEMFGSGSLDIREAANKMEASLKFHGVWNYPTVVFVAHSLGGLVTLRELVAHPERRDRVPLVVLYATPGFGADIARLGTLASRNPALRQLLPADENAVLQQLHQDWQLAERKPTVVCAYEKAEMAGRLIVPWTSAVALCDKAEAAIGGANHIDIVKPDRANHDSVIVLINALNDYVLGDGDTTFLQAPDFTTESDTWVMSLQGARTSARLLNTGASRLDYTVSQVSDVTLAVTPSPTPRSIPGCSAESRNNNRCPVEQLELLLLQGELKDEYSFVLSTATMGDRQVRVRIRDKSAVLAAQTAVETAVAEHLRLALAQPQTAQQLSVMNETERSEAIARIAQEGLVAKLPGTAPQAAAFLTADILSSAGFAQPATKSLEQAGIDTSGSANAESVLHLKARIRERDPAISNEWLLRPGIGANLGESIPNERIDMDALKAEQIKAWSQLSDQMQTVPSLRADGLQLKGDVLNQQGDHEAALQQYQQAMLIKPSPALQERARAVERQR